LSYDLEEVDLSDFLFFLPKKQFEDVFESAFHDALTYVLKKDL